MKPLYNNHAIVYFLKVEKVVTMIEYVLFMVDGPQPRQVLIKSAHPKLGK